MDDVPKVRGREDQTPGDDRMYRLVAVRSFVRADDDQLPIVYEVRISGGE
jgi:hypothetical protein